MNALPRQPAPALLVVCLCAQWCKVCGEYRSRFEQVQKSVQQDTPQARFLWLDVEDEADLLDPLDVENFPTLLIAVADAPRFFGPLAPQPQTLERLIRSYLNDPDARALSTPGMVELLGKIRAAKLD